MNDETLLEYGHRELSAFRADMARRKRDCSVDDRATSDGVCSVLRNADERRNAAGLTPAQAERACILAAKVERHKATP